MELTSVEVPKPTTLKEVRTSKLRPFGPVLSGIDKKIQKGRVLVSYGGLTDDEHDLTFHGGVDKAVHQYCSSHYAFWRSTYSEEPAMSRFVAGGFGENLVADGFDETNVCIGDLVRIGPKDSDLIGGSNGCLLEVSLPRQPCFKLNQRFGIKNFAPKTHQTSKTGWYYRVKEAGFIEAGMEISIIQRDHSKWTIERLHHYVHRDKEDLEVAQELIGIDILGDECKDVFKQRCEQAVMDKARAKQTWRHFCVVSKTCETPRIVRLQLQASEHVEDTDIKHGSYAMLRLPNGLHRAYSVVGGTTDCFTLGIARDDQSRGGSVYIHDTLKVGDSVFVGALQRSMEPNGMASHSIFVVGGIGITAFIAMMTRQIKVNQTLELHYAVRTADEVAFKRELSELGPNVHIYDKSEGQRMDIHNILRQRVWNSQVFTCGPQRMIDAVIAAAKSIGMTEDEVYYEVFAADSTGDPFTVEVVTNCKKTKLDVGSTQSLLQVMRDAGFEMDSSCETGNCGTCRIPVKAGKVLHKGSGLTTNEQETEMLSCVSRGIGHIVVALEKD
ncbi:MOSC domain-containing protein, partial [Aureobasidium melanogenum]